MFVRSWGDPSSKKTALLLHGLASSSISWRKIAKELVADGYYVTAPDLPGHGRSQWEGKYSLEDVSSRIVELLPTKPDLLVGHSIGGLIVAYIAAYKVKATNTVLVDPVFTFPSLPPIVFLTRKIFNLIVSKNFLYGLRKKRFGKREANIMLNNTRHWDTATTLLLKSDVSLVKKFITQNKNILIVRPERSYLLPQSLIRRFPVETVKTVTVKKTSHNLHLEDKVGFIDILKDFLNITTEPGVVNAPVVESVTDTTAIRVSDPVNTAEPVVAAVKEETHRVLKPVTNVTPAVTV